MDNAIPGPIFLSLDDEVKGLAMASTKQHARLAETVEAYLDYRRARGASKATMTCISATLRRLAQGVGDLQVRNLRPQHVTDWFYGPGGQHDWHWAASKGGGKKKWPPISPATHNQYRSTLVTFFNWTTKRGLTKYDMLEDVEFMKVPPKQRLRPGPEVMLDMLEATDNPRDRGYLAVAVNTGMRASEIHRLKVADVDLEQGVIFTVISKTHGEEDYLPITADLDRELRRWLTFYAEDIEGPVKDEYWLFPHYTTALINGKERVDGVWQNTYAERRLRPRVPWRRGGEHVVKRALERVGYANTKGEGVHTVRRAVARAYFDSMRDDTGYESALRTVAALLHHKQVSTTERYLGLSSEKTRRDMMLRGKPFLTGMRPPEENVVPIRRKPRV